MNTPRKFAVTAGLVVALAAAGYSFYATFVAKPPDKLTPEQREKAMNAIANFSKGKPGGSDSSGGKKP